MMLNAASQNRRGPDPFKGRRNPFKPPPADAGWSSEQDSFREQSFGLKRLGAASRDPEPAAGKSGPEMSAPAFALRWLRFNCGVAAGTLATAAVIGAAGALSYTFLSNLGATGWLKAWVVFSGLATTLLGVGYSILHRKSLDLDQGAGYRERHRVEEKLNQLCRTNNLPIPEVAFSRKAGWGGMLDRFFKRDIVLLNPEKVAVLNDRELEALLAHEISHSNRKYSSLRLGIMLARIWSGPGIMFGSLCYLKQAIGGGNWFTGALAWTAAWCLASGVLRLYRTAVGLTWNIASRANESKTDLRAARLTRDPRGMIELFEQLRRDSVIEREPLSFRRLLTHPPTELRIDRVRNWFKKR